METVETILFEARRAFREAGLPTPDLDARLLVGDLLGLDRAGLILKGWDTIGEEKAALARSLIARRLAGEPVHRILGRRSFHAHEFRLSPETLEPRPDTEILVELAAGVLRERFGAHTPFTFADLGTGTGAVAVSLLALFPAAACVAVDLSEGALFMARQNAEAAGVADRFIPFRGDYLDAIGMGLQAVVSNPPYIPTGVIAGLAREVREFDPLLALDGGVDGLDAYRRIIAGTSEILAAGDDLFLEIGEGQEDAVTDLAEEAGLQLRRMDQDLGGVLRALWFAKAS